MKTDTNRLIEISLEIKMVNILIEKVLEIKMKEFEDANPGVTEEQKNQNYKYEKTILMDNLKKNESSTIGYLNERIKLG